MIHALIVLVTVVASSESVHGGMESVLREARIGQTFTAFVDVHPDAVYADVERRQTPVSPEQPDSLLIVYDSDPFLHLRFAANFGFNESGLYELVAVWSGEPETVAARRRRFFTAVTQRHGMAFLRSTILISPATPEERAVAVFLWHEKDAVALAFYTPPSPIDLHPHGALSYAQFAPNDPFLNDIMDMHPPTDAQREQAWQDMEEVVRFLEEHR